MTDHQSGLPAEQQSGTPTRNSMRRALRRARDGVALDVGEAAVLLRARGEDLDELVAVAGPSAQAVAARCAPSGHSSP